MPNGNVLELRISGLSGRIFYDIIETVKAIPGRKYRDGIWLVPVNQAGLLLEVFGDELTWEVPYEEIVKEPSKPETPPIKIIDVNLKLALYPFQLVGASFLVHIKKGLLGDEMGLGSVGAVLR